MVFLCTQQVINFICWKCVPKTRDDGVLNIKVESVNDGVNDKWINNYFKMF